MLLKQTTLTRKLQNLDLLIRRYKIKQNYIKNKLSKQNDTYRKSRTRTLIQLGGLIDKAGLIDIFDITPGEDLQADYNARKKAAELLGFLVEAIHNNKNEPENFTRWNKLGQRYLSQ